MARNEAVAAIADRTDRSVAHEPPGSRGQVAAAGCAGPGLSSGQPVSAVPTGRSALPFWYPQPIDSIYSIYKDSKTPLTRCKGLKTPLTLYKGLTTTLTLCKGL